MKNSKVVTIAFIAAGAIVWFLGLHYIAQWVGYFQLARRLGGTGSDLVRQGVPLLLGFATVVALKTNTKASYFVSDSVDELFRVVFPDAKSVRMGTTLVIILVILAGIIFGALDWGFTSLIKTLIGIRS